MCEAGLIDTAGQRPARPSVTGAAVSGAECERGPLIIGHKM